MKETIKILAETNDRQYNILKAIEECQELALILTQHLSKGAPDNKIIEEIGDVQFRVKVLSKLFDKKAIKARYKHKVSKCQEYLDAGKYLNAV